VRVTAGRSHDDDSEFIYRFSILPVTLDRICPSFSDKRAVERNHENTHNENLKFQYPITKYGSTGSPWQFYSCHPELVEG
jgi:hypothetical protein